MRLSILCDLGIVLFVEMHGCGISRDLHVHARNAVDNGKRFRFAVLRLRLSSSGADRGPADIRGENLSLSTRVFRQVSARGQCWARFLRDDVLAARGACDRGSAERSLWEEGKRNSARAEPPPASDSPLVQRRDRPCASAMRAASTTLGTAATLTAR